MSKKTKFIEVITGEKIEGDVDPTRMVEGTSTPRADTAEVGGHSAEDPFVFECPWCGAINYAVGGRETYFFICFACGRPMRLALA